MPQLQQVADTISTAAGWRKAAPDPDGIVRFFLKDGLEMSISSPDGRTALFQGEVSTLPADKAAADLLLQKAARLAVGAMKFRACVLSLTGEVITLHTALRLDAPAPLCVAAAKNLLNDLAWWRAQLVEKAGRSSATSFSLAGFGNGRF